jgi:hypothetical protein
MSRSHWSGRAYIGFPFACSPDPESIRRALAGAVSIGTGPVARDHLHAGVLSQPGSQGSGLAVRQQVHDGAALQVHQRRPVAVASAPCPIIDAQHARGRGRLDAAAARAHGPEQGVWAGVDGQPRCEPRAGFPVQR